MENGEAPIRANQGWRRGGVVRLHLWDGRARNLVRYPGGSDSQGGRCCQDFC